MLSVALGTRKLLGITTGVVALKPSCVTIGLLEYEPVGFRFDIAIGCTNIPKPPRNTVLPPNLSGLQAKPTRGLTRFEVLSQIDPSCGVANVRPPGTAKLPAGICGIGFLLYAAMAAAAIGFADVVSKPFTVLPNFSE